MPRLSLPAFLPRLPLLVAGLMVAFWTLLRVGLLFWTGIDQVPAVLWPRIFLFGLWFDLAVAAALLAPVCLYEALLPERWRGHRVHRALRFVWLTLSVGVLLFGVASEITFWQEFSTRFNFIAVDYLIYSREVIGNIRQSYPVGLILAGLGALSLGVTWSLRRRLAWADATGYRWRGRLALVAAGLALPVALLYLANVDQMDGSGNAYADELSGNGLFSLAAAMCRNELDYDRFYATMPQEQADAVLARLGVERAPLGEAAPAASATPAVAEVDEGPEDVTPFRARPRNVVLITVESLSAGYVGVYGPRELYRGLTPELDRLAGAGVLFDQVYATGTRTVRGLEALSLGTPPVPGQAIVRRLNNDNLTTVGGILARQGYSSLFIYGGYGYFDNMNAYYAANGYRVIDRTDIPRADVKFENVWGVADEVLFDHTLKVLDGEQRAGKPFFAQIMTTSNHRPFTYPDGRIDIKSPGNREGGVKYTDYAIGKFLRDARSRPWFKDTLFVIIADHCASVAGKSRLPVEGYHIPMIFYAPELLPPGRVRERVSQIDVAPTLLEVLGKVGDNHFFGRSLFEPGPPPQRAFISNYQELGYYKGDILTVLLPRQRVEAYHIDPASRAATPIEVDAALRDEAVAYYQTAARAFKRGALRDRGAPLPPTR